MYLNVDDNQIIIKEINTIIMYQKIFTTQSFYVMVLSSFSPCIKLYNRRGKGEGGGEGGRYMTTHTPQKKQIVGNKNFGFSYNQ